MKHAEVKQYNGDPTIFVDGKPITAMSMTLCRYENDAYLTNLGKSGIKIFYIYAATNWLRPNGFARFEKCVNTVLKNIPDAYIFVRLSMHPPKEWVENHPDDIMRYSDGEPMPCTLYWEEKEDYCGHYSLASENWQKDASAALIDFCEKVDKSSFSDRIIGYFFCAGGSDEWYYAKPVIDFEKNRVADYSPAFKKVYSKYLRKKYKTEENLKKAWRMEDASFDNPIIPSLEDRRVIDEEKDFLDKAQRAYVGSCCDRSENASTVGLFLNVDTHMYVKDFYDAWHTCVADSIICFGNVIKDRYKDTGMLTGAFFGNWACTNFYDSPTSGGARRVLESDSIDFLSSPPTYVNRQPGGFAAQRVMQDSFRLKNKIFITEEDTRTHLQNPPIYNLTFGLYSENDSVKVMKRDFARNICDGTFAWWFDMEEGDGVGWYNDEIFYKLFTAQQKIAKLSCEHHRCKSNEVAAIYSTESLHLVSRYTSELMIDYHRNSELYRIGTGLDFYLLEDLEDMPDYKVYLMINEFSLSDAERRAIIKKASKNGAMIIWHYAPGLINPDAETRLSVDNIENITGIRTKMKSEICIPEFNICRPVPEAVKYADIDRAYGYLDRYLNRNIQIKRAQHEPNIAYSYFYIDDDSVEVLGRYNFSGEAALAMKKDENGITHVYCAAKTLRSELIMSLAEYAGCHIYNKQDDCVYVNNNFVTVHAKFTGKHILYFRENCSPFEVYERRYYAKNVNTLEVDMEKGDTLMFSINDTLSSAIENMQ